MMAIRWRQFVQPRCLRKSRSLTRGNHNYYAPLNSYINVLLQSDFSQLLSGSANTRG